VKPKSVWSKEVRKVLVEFVEEYRQGNTEARRQLFSKDILPALRKLHPTLDGDRWKKMKDVSKRLFQELHSIAQVD
jgi:hypothetical protein